MRPEADYRLKYDASTRDMAMKLVLDAGKTLPEVSKDMDVPVHILHEWVEAEIAALEERDVEREDTHASPPSPHDTAHAGPAVDEDSGDRVPTDHTVIKFRCEHCGLKLKTYGVPTRDVLKCRHCHRHVSAPTHADDPRVYYFEESAGGLR